MADEQMEQPEIAIADTVESKAVALVNADFKRAKKYLQTWHEDCNERYKHYRAAGLAKNILKDSQFPTPFTTEQVDTLRADIMDKVWYKGQPCSIYGAEDTDQADAEAKAAFMKYQDEADNLFDILDQGVMSGALYGPIPAVVNYKEEYETRMVPVDVPVTDEAGKELFDLDGQTPLIQQQMQFQQVPVYQGATVELVDVIDFFFTPEKRDFNDEHPVMIRNRRTKKWFKDQSYIIHKNIAKLDEEIQGGHTDEDSPDLLKERREIMGYITDDDKKPKGIYEYVEWHGWADLDGEVKLWILGVADGRVLMRMDDAEEIFHLGKPNIVVGYIGKDAGEPRGESLLDKFHSIQHAMDSMMGLWIKAMRQTVNPMWKVWTDKLKTKVIVNDSGQTIECHDNPDNVVQRCEQEQVSKDIYMGLEMLRTMGMNASRINDIAKGQVQQGVETLGEASILASNTALGLKRYLRTFEKTFIEPLWKMRNRINMNFVTDAGYVYQVIGEKAIDWRVIEPHKVRANVDFVCESSTRENQKAVRSQQILQAINLELQAASILGPVPIISLFKKYFEEGLDFNQQEIQELLPMELIIQNLMMQQQMAQQQAMGKNPGSMPQPTTEGDAQQSAQQQFTPDVGAIG